MALSESCSVVLVVYFGIFLDNVLLTVVVPIIPDILASKTTFDPHDILSGDESARVGGLFAAKALVQLVVNPFVGKFTDKFGFDVPLIIGASILGLSSLSKRDSSFLNCLMYFKTKIKFSPLRRAFH